MQSVVSFMGLVILKGIMLNSELGKANWHEIYKYTKFCCKILAKKVGMDEYVKLHGSKI